MVLHRYGTGLLLSSILAAAVAGLVAYTSCEPHQINLGLTLAPFGSPHVLLAHLLTALPFSLLAARVLSRRLRVDQVETWTISWMGVGAAIAILASIVSAGLGGDLVDTSFTLRAIYRVFWCVLLELPWCCAFARTNRESDQYVPGRLDLGLALAAALVLPGAYALHVADEETKRIEGMLEHGRVLKARAALELVRQLGAHEPIRIKNRDYVEQNMSIAELRKYLDTEIERSTEIVKSPLPWSAPLAYKLEQCRRLGMLDRCEEAERQLRPLASTDLDAKWLLGWVLQERERWDESSASIREVLEARVGKADSDPRALERSLACFNELAYNARGKGDYAAAEAIYFEALDRLPSSAGAYFHFLLGQHYSKGGRPASAIEHLRQAADLDPVKYREQSRKIIDGLRRSTPACVLK